MRTKADNMSDRFAKLYLDMVLELRRRLDEADIIFAKMSELLVASMTGETTARDEKEFAALYRKYRSILTAVMDGALKLYPDRIAIFPDEDGGNLVAAMENRNAQFEELERVVNLLLESCGHSCGNHREETVNQWRQIMENVDFKAEFEQRLANEKRFDKRPNILVAGYTGCGKTSLIRTVLGNGLVPESRIIGDKPSRMDFDCYEDETVRLWDSRGLELGDAESEFLEEMKEFVAEQQDNVDVDEHIHLVWYLIQGNGARATDSDLKLIKEIFTFDDVIVVISKRDITRPEQAEAIRKVLVDAGVPETRIIEVADAKGGAAGCRQLVDSSKEMLPEAYRDAFMSAQSIDREAKTARVAGKSDRALAIVADAISAAQRLAETPIPVADSSLLVPPQVEMMAKLASLYGLRDTKVRENAAAFVDSVVAFFSGSLGELGIDAKPAVDAESAAILTGALGHFVKNSFEAWAIARIKGTPLPDPGFDCELFKQFYKNYKHGMNMKPNILVCGKTGVGKTSLIQAVTHRGVVPDSAIGNGRPATRGFQLYETEIASFVDSEGMNPGEQSVDDYADLILDEMLSRLGSDDKYSLIHNIWYCIDGSGARIQEADIRLIKTFSDKVILVVTKCELMRKEQTEAVMNTLLGLIDRDRIALVSAENKTGLNQLVAMAQSMSEKAVDGAQEEMDAFRDRWNNYYADMRRDWSGIVGSDADDYINWAAGRAAAIAIVPLPLADVAPLVANEIYMIYKLAGVYGIAIDNAVVTMLLGCAGGSIVGKIGASFLPFLKIPIAAAVTYGVGKAAKAYFESDMTMNISELRKKFLEGEREAKKREWKPVEE